MPELYHSPTAFFWLYKEKSVLRALGVFYVGMGRREGGDKA